MTATASDASGSKTPVPTLAPPQGWGFFAMGNAQVIDIDDVLNAPGGEIKTAGITLGADAQIAHNLVMGVAFDYVNSDIDFDYNGSATVEGAKGSIFATWFNGKYYLDGAIGGGVNSYDTKRATLGDPYPTIATPTATRRATTSTACSPVQPRRTSARSSW